MTPLRRDMERNLRLRKLAPGTCKLYIAHVTKYALYFGRSPARLGARHAREFLLNLLECGRAPATVVVYHAALRFLYLETLGRPEVMATVPRPRVRSSDPRRPLTQEEVAALLEVAVEQPFCVDVVDPDPNRIIT